MDWRHLNDVQADIQADCQAFGAEFPNEIRKAYTPVAVEISVKAAIGIAPAIALMFLLRQKSPFLFISISCAAAVTAEPTLKVVRNIAGFFTPHKRRAIQAIQMGIENGLCILDKGPYVKGSVHHPMYNDKIDKYFMNNKKEFYRLRFMGQDGKILTGDMYGRKAIEVCFMGYGHRRALDKIIQHEKNKRARSGSAYPIGLNMD